MTAPTPLPAVTVYGCPVGGCDFTYVARPMKTSLMLDRSTTESVLMDHARMHSAKDYLITIERMVRVNALLLSTLGVAMESLTPEQVAALDLPPEVMELIERGWDDGGY